MRRALQVSLLLNLLLLTAAVWRHVHPPPASLRTAAGMGLATTNAPRQTRSASARPPAAPTPWDRIDSRDTAQFIANLRSIGCPEQTIRDIVTFRVCREFRERWIAFETDAARDWDLVHYRTRQSLEESSARHDELRDEMATTLESLLGGDSRSIVNSVLGWPGAADDSMATLSIEQRRKLREINRRYDALRRQLEQDILEAQDPDLENRRRDLEKKKHAELAALLSPDQFQEYSYRRSAAADYVRQNAPEAKSEAEFRAMVRIAQEVGLDQPSISWTVRPDPDNAALNDYNQRKAEFDRRLKDLLGEGHLAELQAEEQAAAREADQRATERREVSERARLADLIGGVGVSPQDATRFVDRLWEMRPAFSVKFSEMEKNLQGTPEEKEQQMKAAVRVELEKLAVETFGDKGHAVADKIMEDFH